jgi:hypothetical protein
MDHHAPTGKTVHRLGDEVLPPPHNLQIAQYPGDSGYYLFYLDERGEVQTDTWHEDIRSAMRQAEFEFGVKFIEWEKAEPARLA